MATGDTAEYNVQLDTYLICSFMLSVEDAIGLGTRATPAKPATGATAGIPGTWTPAGSTPPINPASMTGVTASPATPWTTGQFVQTRTTGAPGRTCWTGTGWVGGAAP